MVGQRQLGSWATIPGHLHRLGLQLYNGSRAHLSSLLVPGSQQHPETVYVIFLGPSLTLVHRPERMQVHSLTDGPGLSHTLWQDGP